MRIRWRCSAEGLTGRLTEGLIEESLWSPLLMKASILGIVVGVFIPTKETPRWPANAHLNDSDSQTVNAPFHVQKVDVDGRAQHD